MGEFMLVLPVWLSSDAAVIARLFFAFHHCRARSVIRTDRGPFSNPRACQSVDYTTSDEPPAAAWARV
jgi:hypothetical protein